MVNDRLVGLGQVLSGLDNQIEKGAVCYISRTALSDEGYIVLVSFDEELAYCWVILDLFW